MYEKIMEIYKTNNKRLDELLLQTKNHELAIYAEENDTIDHFFGAGGKEDYEAFAEVVKHLGFNSVIDIGCAYGHQSECFTALGITYTGIEMYNYHFYDVNNPLCKYINGKYENLQHINEGKPSIGISRLCVGYLITDAYEKIALDFDYFILSSTNEAYEKMQKYFDIAKIYPGFILFKTKTDNYNVFR